MNRLLRFINLNTRFKDNMTYRHFILVNGILVVIILFFIFFALFNYFILHRPDITFLNTIAAIITLLILIHLTTTNNITFTAKLATINLMVFLLAFIYNVGSEHFSLIWTIFLPTFAIFANGRKLGLYFSLLFYALLFTMAYMYIGVWDKGNWAFQDWVRLVSASSLLTFGMYLNESAYEEYDRQLKLVRANEQRLMLELSKQSITDQLTNLYNRRYYDTVIDKVIATAKRHKKCITFFILDIDHFKRYNDYYGHKKGDEVLIKVAHTLKKHIQREDDFVFRLGGEEFAGIITSEDKEKTQEWIAQLCDAVEKLKIEHKKSHISAYLTVSLGMVSKCSDEDFNANSLYLDADKALYKAKSQGRNRCKTLA
ncbi:GGDEF domain-containing protein [Sulfurimonas sp.]